MTTWVFHRGALGDSILLWPALRALGPRGVLVSEAAKAALAARSLGVRATDLEQRRFNDLWVAGAARPEPIPGAARIFTFLAGDDRPGRTWLANAARLFPGATIEARRAPLNRRTALAIEGLPPAPAAPRDNPGGPIILHVGAGSREKRWPLECWTEVARALPGAIPIAGEVERERFDAGAHALFASLDGRWIDSLEGLADLILSARLVLAADSGPGHLAAQLGIPTLSLFGPTDPGLWAPIGPRARTLAPPSPRAMAWLSPEAVLAAIA